MMYEMKSLCSATAEGSCRPGSSVTFELCYLHWYWAQTCKKRSPSSHVHTDTKQTAPWDYTEHSSTMKPNLVQASDCFSAVQHLDILILREPWLWMELQVVCWPLHTQEFYSNLTERGPPWLHQHIWLYSLPLTKSIFSIISVQRGIKPITIRDGYEYLFISLMNHRGGSYFLFLFPSL